MPQTAAERMATTRARRRGLLPPPVPCETCGAPLKPSGIGRSAAAGLCWRCWAATPEGRQFTLEARRLRREKAAGGPRPLRYFGAIPGREEEPEGPFNRLRLAVSSAYAGKGKPRGLVWVVWSDGAVTQHEGVRQSDVTTVTRSAGLEVDRPDLADLARSLPALEERIRHYGRGLDVVLID
jgi:hypothetical protein